MLSYLSLALLAQAPTSVNAPLTYDEPTQSSRRTLGTPVSGFWDRTHGTGALPSTISPSAKNITRQASGGVPNSFSWNGYFGGSDYMTPIKDQGSCGSCWAFASVGAMEAQYQIGKSNPNTGLDLSEQYVLSCSGGTCSGWYIDYALNFLRDSGTPDEACDRYVGTTTACGTGRCADYGSRLYKINGWTWIDTSAVNIKNYIYTHGPVMVWMPVFDDFPWYDASFWQYSFYSHSPSGSYGGHFVVIVGWDDQGAGTADDYWIVRNSWGTSGGDVNEGYGGYFYMTQDSTTGFFGIYQEAAIVTSVAFVGKVSLSISVNPTAGGSVSVSPAASSYSNGASVTAKAKAATGYSFLAWGFDGYFGNK